VVWHPKKKIVGEFLFPRLLNLLGILARIFHNYIFRNENNMVVIAQSLDFVEGFLFKKKKFSNARIHSVFENMGGTVT